TITDCPCTVTKPVITTSAVVCHDCPAPPAHHGNNSTLVPVYPTGKPGHGGESGKPGSPAGPGATPTAGAPSEVPTAGAGKVAALSGAGLAAVVGLAAFL
ncbi:putative clock-controlled 6 (CCG-6), partial [Fusarium globosum]